MGYMNKEQRMSISPKEYQQTLMEEAGMIAAQTEEQMSPALRPDSLPLPTTTILQIPRASKEGRPTGLFAIHSIKQTKLCENATRGRKRYIY